MKVTYLINQYPKVSHSFIRREIIALENQGVDVHRVSIRGWNAEIVDAQDKREQSKTKYILASGIAALLLPTFIRCVKSPKKFLKTFLMAMKLSRYSERNVFYHLIYLFEACKLVALCDKEKSSHIHAHFGTNSTEVAMLAHLLGGPTYSFTVHGPEEFDKPLGLHLKEKIRYAKFVAAISSFGRSQLYRWADYSDWGKINIVHCGLDKEFFNGTAKANKHNGTKSLICVGRLCEQKGQLLLIKAVKKVVDQKIGVFLTLAGDGDMRPEVEALIKEHELEPYINITGWISSDEVKALLHSADAMILPSFAEGLPVAIMEAMACKTAVLTTYIAGIPELVKSNKTGWLFPAGDVTAISKSIVSFIETDEEDLNIIRNNAYAEVSSRHCIETEAKKLVQLFES